MQQTSFFETVVERSTVHLGVFAIIHEIDIDGRIFAVTHSVSKNVMTDFDDKLSRYLAAVKGAGLPGASVVTRMKDVASGLSSTPFPASRAASVPHALATAVKLVLGWETSRNMKIGAWTGDDSDLDATETVSTGTVETLERALEVCKQIGPIEFLEISGDFKRLLVKPSGSKMRMMVLDLHRGLISIPSSGDAGGTEWQGPLHAFEKAAAESPGAIAFLAQARHAVTLAKEHAIYAFREAAEDRIMRFDKALGGRPLTGHRLESGAALVARLQAGMGSNLFGLDEAAQVTALEWATEVGEHPRGARSPASTYGGPPHTDLLRRVAG